MYKILEFKKKNIFHKTVLIIVSYIKTLLFCDYIPKRYYFDESYRQKVDAIFDKIFQYHYDNYLIKAEQYAYKKADADIKKAIYKNRINKLYRKLCRCEKMNAGSLDG